MLAALATLALAGPFDTPDAISWTLPGGSAPCHVDLSREQYRCGYASWAPLPGGTDSLRDALRQLKPQRLLGLPPTHQEAPALTLHRGDDQVSFRIYDPSLVAVVDEARQLIAAEAMPELGCTVVLHAFVAATPRHGGDTLRSSDLRVCEGGAWMYSEEDQLVARGALSEGAMALLMAEAAPLQSLPDPRRPDVNYLCPTVIRTHGRGLSVFGTGVPPEPCGGPQAQTHDVMRLMRELVDVPSTFRS